MYPRPTYVRGHDDVVWAVVEGLLGDQGETTGLLLAKSFFCRRAWEASVSWQRSGYHRQHAGRRGQTRSRCCANDTPTQQPEYKSSRATALGEGPMPTLHEVLADARWG